MAAPAQTPPLGRGGKEHRYLQNLIKEFAISKGYHAVIEEEILGGAGRVDVSLALKDQKIACEISVTTGRDHEFGNIEKCLGAGYARIIFVSSDARHLAAMEKLADHHFEEEDRAKLQFASPEDAIGLLARWCGDAEVKTVRGYKVWTTVEAGDPAEQGHRRATVASVIARSLRNEKE